MKKLINLFVMSLLLSIAISCSDDKSTSPNGDNGTGSSGPGEVILYTELDYVIMNSENNPNVVSYDQEVHNESEFSTQGSFQKSNEKLVWVLDNNFGGSSNFGFTVEISADELVKKEYNWGNGDDTILEGSAVYQNGRSGNPTQILKSKIIVDSYIDRVVDSRDYAIISGTAEFTLNSYNSSSQQEVLKVNFKYLKIELFE